MLDVSAGERPPGTNDIRLFGIGGYHIAAQGKNEPAARRRLEQLVDEFSGSFLPRRQVKVKDLKQVEVLCVMHDLLDTYADSHQAESILKVLLQRCCSLAAMAPGKSCLVISCEKRQDACALLLVQYAAKVISEHERLYAQRIHGTRMIERAGVVTARELSAVAKYCPGVLDAVFPSSGGDEILAAVSVAPWTSKSHLRSKWVRSDVHGYLGSSSLSPVGLWRQLEDEDGASNDGSQPHAGTLLPEAMGESLPASPTVLPIKGIGQVFDRDQSEDLPVSLLQALVDYKEGEFGEVQDALVFENEAVQLLVSAKWETFGRSRFLRHEVVPFAFLSGGFAFCTCTSGQPLEDEHWSLIAVSFAAKGTVVIVSCKFLRDEVLSACTNNHGFVSHFWRDFGNVADVMRYMLCIACVVVEYLESGLGHSGQFRSILQASTTLLLTVKTLDCLLGFDSTVVATTMIFVS